LEPSAALWRSVDDATVCADVELDPDIEEHSLSDPNDALGAASPEMTKSSEKGERDEKGRSRPLLYEKGARKDHSTAKYI
jgi:hypothetical protein